MPTLMALLVGVRKGKIMPEGAARLVAALAADDNGSMRSQGKLRRNHLRPNRSSGLGIRLLLMLWREGGRRGGLLTVDGGAPRTRCKRLLQLRRGRGRERVFSLREAVGV